MFLSNKYNNLLKTFESNKDKNWKDWLEFDKVLDKPGKQGVVGLLKIKNKSTNNSDNPDDYNYLFKISQCINYLAYHELVVMKGLNTISKFCPHFCKGIGTIKAVLEPNRKSKNPFELTSKYGIEKEILLLEYIDNSTKFYNYIRSENISEDILYSIIKQVLMGINIAQVKKKFTHYDLHSNNIMIKKCNKDLVFIYKIDDENQFAVPTFGRYPVIIDFGFSYIEDMDGGPLWTSLAHTDVGFMSDRFDWVADPKLFLITVSDEIKSKKGTKKSKCLRRVVRNIFSPLKIELDSGWDEGEKKGAVDYVLDIFESYNDSSKIFQDYDYYCIDILQSLIILPLEEQDHSKLGKYFEIFLKEWVKIENQISNEFYNIYILKEIVNIARELRYEYINEDDKNSVIKKFSRGIHESLQKISKFCNPKKVNYEKMLCSLYLLARNIEGVLYDIISARMKEKEKEYSKMPLKNMEQIYGAIDVNIPDTYEYNKNTVFLIMDCQKESYDLFDIPQNEISEINSMKNMFRGTYIYDLYEKDKLEKIEKEKIENEKRNKRDKRDKRERESLSSRESRFSKKSSKENKNKEKIKNKIRNRKKYESDSDDFEETSDSD